MGGITMTAILTYHGEDRIMEREGLNKKSVQKIANKALKDGIKHSDTVGSLKRFLDKLYLAHKNANNIRILNRKVYLFHKEFDGRNVLITVINLPYKYHKTVDKIKNKIKQAN